MYAPPGNPAPQQRRKAAICFLACTKSPGNTENSEEPEQSENNNAWTQVSKFVVSGGDQPDNSRERLVKNTVMKISED